MLEKKQLLLREMQTKCCKNDSQSGKCKTLVGFRRAVIFSVKEYTNNELTKTKNKKKQNKTK